MQPQITDRPEIGDRPVRSHTIAIVGDVHDQWDADDEAALKHLGVDLVLLVGDFGNEAVDIVRAIAQMDIPKAVILGNHDAWYTATDWGRRKCPYNREQEDRVQQQLDLLGVTHVGYSKLDIPELQLSVVGGRPFSWGGPTWKHKKFYRDRYGVRNLEESTIRIIAAVEAAAYETLIFIGHCGPYGLGDRPEDPCGRDWKPSGGDFGDADLTAAIAHARQIGKRIPLVTFGHMHHDLRHRKDRLRKIIEVTPEGTVYLNAASVPRIIGDGGDRQRNFSLITLHDQTVISASLVWVSPTFEIVSEQSLYQTLQPIAQGVSTSLAH